MHRTRPRTVDDGLGGREVTRSLSERCYPGRTVTRSLNGQAYGYLVNEHELNTPVVRALDGDAVLSAGNFSL